MCDVHIGRRDEAVTLRAVITAVSSTLELDELLAGVVDIATEAIACHACLIYLVEDDRLVLRAASPVHRPLVGRVAMGLDEGIAGWVARRREPALIRDDALHDPRMKYFPELDEERYQSMAAVPVASRSGEVIGVIVLHTVAPHEFGEEVVGLLTHTASLVGGAIENAQLYEQARRRVHALTQLAGASQRLAAATEHAQALRGGHRRGARAARRRALPALPPRRRPRRAAARGLGPAGGAGAAAARRRAAARAARPRPPRRLRRATCGPGTRARRCSSATLVASEEQLGVLCVLGGRARRFGPGDEELLRRAGRPDGDGHAARRADRAAHLARPRQGPLPGAGGRRVRRRRPARGAGGLRPQPARTSW